jgi:tRNA(Arg) A34 adenosine deaminase TadA
MLSLLFYMAMEHCNDIAPFDAHDYYMGLALAEAKNAEAQSEVPVGAVLVGRGGEILGRAHNSPIAFNDPTAHAEILAMRRGAALIGNYRLSGVRLYVTLEPCAMCVGAMLHARVGMLVFGASDPKGGAAGSVVDLTNVPLFNHTIEVVRGIRSEECAELLQRFFRERRRDKK